MALLIRGGTVVNHDHSRRADVLIDGDTITAIAPAIEPASSAEIIDAGGAYVLTGGIDPHTHLEMPFMGTVTADDFESGTRAALTGGTTMVVDFCLPDPGRSMLAAYQRWRRKSERAVADYGFHMAVTSWSKQVFDEMETVVGTCGINTFKHFMAYKGALMVNGDRGRSATRRIRIVCGPACNPARCRWSRPITARSRPSRSGSAATTSAGFRTGPAASRTACRCSGPRASQPAG